MTRPARPALLLLLTGAALGCSRAHIVDGGPPDAPAADAPALDAPALDAPPIDAPDASRPITPARPTGPTGPALPTAPTLRETWVPSIDAPDLAAVTPVEVSPEPPQFGDCGTWNGGAAAPCEPWPAGGREPSCAGDAEHFAGEDACLPVGDACPTDWDPDVPSSAVFVQAGGGGGDGTSANPYTRLEDAIAAVGTPASRVVIALAPGTYTGAFVLPPNVTLWGACPASTVISAATSGATALTAGAASTITNLRVAGGARGIAVPGGISATVDHVIVERASTGIDVVGGTLSARDVVIRESPAALANNRGLLVAGGNASLTRSVVRHVYGENAHGIEARGSASVTLTDVAVHHVEQAGVVSRASSALTADGLVVENAGAGVVADGGGSADLDRLVSRDHSFDGFGSLNAGQITIDRALISNVWAWGLSLHGPSTVRDVIVRNVRRALPDEYQLWGYGIRCWDNALTVNRMRVESVEGPAIGKWGSGTLHVTSLDVIDAGTNHNTNGNGSGVTVSGSTFLTLRRSRIERAHGAGVLLGPETATVATLEDVEIVDTLPSTVGTLRGHAVAVAGSASATLRRVRATGGAGEAIGAGHTAIGVPEWAAYPPVAVVLEDVMSQGANGGIFAADGVSVTGGRFVSAGDSGPAIAARGALTSVVLTDVIAGDGDDTAAALAVSAGATLGVQYAHVLRWTGPTFAGDGEPTTASLADLTVERSGEMLAGTGARLEIERAVIRDALGPLITATDTVTRIIVTDLLALGGTAESIACLVRRGATATFERVEIEADGRALVVTAEGGSSLSASNLQLTCAGAPSSPCAGLVAMGGASVEAQRVAVDSARGLGAGAYGGGSRLDLEEVWITDTGGAPCGSETCSTALGVYDFATASATNFLMRNASNAGAQLGTDGVSLSLMSGSIAGAPVCIALGQADEVIVTETFLDCETETTRAALAEPAPPVLP